MVQLAITIFLVAVLGMVAFVLTSRKPEFFWPLLIGLPIVFSGFMIAGRAVADEYFLAAVIAGGFWATRRGLVPQGTGERVSLHWWVFLFAVVYFALQSVRGMFVLEDIKILRWVGYFVLFGALFLLIRRWQFPFPRAVSVVRITALASSIYFGVYTVLGLVSECVLGTARWLSQGMLWAGSSYAIFPLLFSFPAALSLLKSDSRQMRRLGWFTLLITVFAVGYYESRVGWLALFGMLLFVPLVLGFRRTLSVAPGLVIILGFALLFSLGPLASPYCNHVLTGKAPLQEVISRLFGFERYGLRLNDFKDGISATVATPISPRASDVDRVLHIKAGFLTLTETPSQLLFGGGTHSYRFSLRPHLERLYHDELPGTEIGPVVRTVGLSAVLVDYGLIGFVLILSNLFFVARILVVSSDWSAWRRASIFLAALITVPFWLLVGDIQDMVIYFLLLSPWNAFTLLVRDS